MGETDAEGKSQTERQKKKRFFLQQQSQIFSDEKFIFSPSIEVNRVRRSLRKRKQTI